MSDVPEAVVAVPTKLKLKKKILIKKRRPGALKTKPSVVVKKLPSPVLSLKPEIDPESLNLADLDKLDQPMYSLVAPVLIKYIESQHLQDENHRTRILLDQTLQDFFQIKEETTSYQQLYHLIKDWIERKKISVL